MIGNLTRDPKTYDTGTTTITNFTVATNYKYKDKNDVYFGDCKAFGKLAELCNQYLKKGSRVFVSGRLTTDTWEKDGEKKSKTSIIIDVMKMLSTPQASNDSEQEEPF
jgi:single-strand DNA-binding protein